MNVARTGDGAQSSSEIFFNEDEIEAVVFERYRDTLSPFKTPRFLARLLSPLDRLGRRSQRDLRRTTASRVGRESNLLHDRLPRLVLALDCLSEVRGGGIGRFQSKRQKRLDYVRRLDGGAHALSDPLGQLR
jgi:hypothetical protein